MSPVLRVPVPALPQRFPAPEHLAISHSGLPHQSSPRSFLLQRNDSPAFPICYGVTNLVSHTARRKQRLDLFPFARDLASGFAVG